MAQGLPNSSAHNTALPGHGPSSTLSLDVIKARPGLRQTAREPVQAVLQGRAALEDPAQGPIDALYIHVPFCFHKCHYCDFYSFVDTQDRQDAFVDRLIHELAALAPLARRVPMAGADRCELHHRPERGRLATIFIGGGTPSLLRVDLWERLLAALHQHFDLSSMGTGETSGPSDKPASEFTVECNPETVTPELMRTLVQGSVNRVSIGAQSFHTQHLKALERWHDPANVRKALDLAREAGIARQSIDLIYAIPGQTFDDWRADLLAALDLKTTHLSCYNLTYEPNTAMAVRLKHGEFAPIDEDLEIEMFELTARLLEAAGLERYEISNYAAPGHECQHNLAYWRQRSWLAAGPSASAHVGHHWWGGSRWKNIPRLDDYLGTSDEGFAPITDLEPPDPARALRERLMTGLRLREGLPIEELRNRTRVLGKKADETWTKLERRAQRLAEQGQLELAAGRWRLTPAGVLLADGLASELMACVPKYDSAAQQLSSS
jgi:oxygen-independent coproporphyrinogen III oxidase